MRDVDPYIIRVGIKRREREEAESSKKDKPCLTKTMMLLLASVLSEERRPDREWVQSDCTTENPGIQKKEDELRLGFWIQTGQRDGTK